MYHSLDIYVDYGTLKNTWNDWHLIPTSRPFVPPPSFSDESVETVGFNGNIDNIRAIGKKETYGDRIMTTEFILADGPDYGVWSERYRAIRTFLHGKRGWISLADDDPSHVFKGLFSVTKFTSGKVYSTIELTFYLEPNRYDRSAGNVVPESDSSFSM